MNGRLGRRALQIVTALIGLLTIALGTLQIVFGVKSPVYAQVAIPHPG